MSIQNEAILVKVTQSTWGNRKSDKDLAAEVISQKGAQQGSISVSKALVDSPDVKALTKISGQITNQLLRRVCLSWEDGVHLLPVDLIDRFEDQLRKFNDQREKHLRSLGETYDDLVAKAQYRLGSAFCESDYPTRDEVLEKYQLTVEYRPLPAGGDLRVDLPAKRLEAIRRDVEAQVQAKVQKAAEVAHDRVVDTLQSLIDGLERHGKKEEGAKRASKFSDNTVEKVKEIAQILPSLNINNDPRLTKAGNDLLTKLRDLDADELRSDPAKRKHTAEQAKAIVDNLNAFFD